MSHRNNRSIVFCAKKNVLKTVGENCNFTEEKNISMINLLPQFGMSESCLCHTSCSVALRCSGSHCLLKQLFHVVFNLVIKSNLMCTMSKTVLK